MIAMTAPRTRHFRLAAVAVTLAAAMGACSGGGAPAPSGGASPPGPGSELAEASASASANASNPAPVSASPGPTFDALPSDFPIPGGVEPVPLPADEGGLIARWTTARPGPEIYEFYLRELPAGGYPIVGRYPGGAAAIIRFEATQDDIWQVVLTGGLASTRIDIRLDRP